MKEAEDEEALNRHRVEYRRRYEPAHEDTCRREEISLDLQIPGNIFRLTEAQLTIGTYHQIFIGGRLQFFTDEWQVISDDPWILDTIKSGLRIEFLE